MSDMSIAQRNQHTGNYALAEYLERRGPIHEDLIPALTAAKNAAVQECLTLLTEAEVRARLDRVMQELGGETSG